MECPRKALLVGALALLGCPRLADPDEGSADEVDTSSGESTSANTESTTSANTEDASSTDASSTDASSTDASSTDASDSTDTGGCPLGLIECPDGTCVGEFPEFGCCGHGGGCAEGCEPQDADKGMGQCPGAPEFAWTGQACEEVCPCQGSDCDSIYASPIACYEAHDGTCGAFDFSLCPFDEPVAAISITGSLPGDTIDLQAGAFGLFYGKGSGNALMLRFAADELTLANHIAHPWDDAYLSGVLQVWADPMVGAQEVTVTWGVPAETMALGTLTILDLDVMNPDSLAYFVTGTLEVHVDGWDLSGSFGSRHCYPLNLYAP